MSIIAKASRNHHRHLRFIARALSFYDTPCSSTYHSYNNQSPVCQRRSVTSTDPFLQIPRTPLFPSPSDVVWSSLFGFKYGRFMCTGGGPATTVNNGGVNQSSTHLKSSESTPSSLTGANSGNNGDGGSSGGSEQQQSQEQGKPVRGAPVSWLSFLLLFATGVALVLYYDKELKKRIEEINSNSNAVKQGPSVGKAAIGGPFNLVDHTGNRVTEKDFMGRWTLIYFGFTHCPDICPDELTKLAAAVNKIKEKSGIQLVPIFISVDPERDTVEQVRDYVKVFHPDLIGLTGSPDEIKKVARAYRVYYMKTQEEGQDYLVDHSIVMYLMDPNMEFVKFFGKNNDVDTLADGIIKEIKQYKKVKA